MSTLQSPNSAEHAEPSPPKQNPQTEESRYSACASCTAKWLSPQPRSRCPRCGGPTLTPVKQTPPWSLRESQPSPSIVSDLETLISDGHRFQTVLADPPWRYENVASRAAAENHYRTMSLDEICSLPIEQLVERNAHLHLWTTNAFLEPAFGVMRAWGFEFKSCMIWVKPTIGMGNYWRVSHEFMVFGVRGRLPFGRNDVPSWLSAPRSVHSRKPFKFRELIEQVSPGPYLELFGREEQPNSGWTVFGDQVERRLF